MNLSRSAARMTAVVGLLIGLALPGLPSVAATSDPAPRTLAIENVTVVPMSSRDIIRDATVLIRDGRIAAIEPARKFKVTSDMQRIDGRGKWLIPGLTDMHVHVENIRMLRLVLNNPDIPADAVSNEDVFLPYLANGVLQVFTLQAMSETIGQRVEIESGRLLGPRVHAAAMIDGSPPIWPAGMTRVATTPEAGRQAVRDAAAEGYDAIKVYSRLSFDTFTAIVDEARKLKLPVIGHLPGRESGRIDDAFPLGFGMVAHAEEFAMHTREPSIDAIPHYVELMKKSGAWLTATLSLNERLVEQTSRPDSLRSRNELHALHPMWRSVVVDHNPYVAQASPERIAHLQKIVDFNRELVRAFISAGVPVVAGSDALVPGVVPGFSMHDELEALVRAGMTHHQALDAATRLPSEWLGVLSDRGTVEVDKRADLLLLDANPLADIGNTRKISAVIIGGRYLPRQTLDERMRALMLKELPQVRFPAPRRVVSGALDATHLEAVKAAGIQHVVTLRPAEENPDFDEPSAVAALGLEFHAIPIKGPQSLTRENAQALDKILDEIGDEPAVLHCSSGNRVGALIALREAWINGKSPDEAIAIGKRWGLAGLEKAVGTALSPSTSSP